uniref:Serpin family B member 10 n=1 Tax=Otus sunia TaxID=257818 RepID=A0A8C8AMY9_9STRI
MEALNKANTSFALDFFKHECQEDSDKNILFSPLSISSALATVYLGAKGNTADQMAKVSLAFKCIHTGKQQTFITPITTYLQLISSSMHAISALTISLAYIRRNCTNTYVKTIKLHKCVKVLLFSLGKIQNLLPPGSIDSLTRLVLINALYFKGNWATKFQAEATRQRPFRINTHTTKPVPMMYLSDKFNWTYIESVQTDVLELPYVNNDLSMFILLPSDITGLQKLERELTFENLSAWTSPEMMEKMKMEVYLPRFTLEEKYDLKSTLSRMGIQDAFTEGQADFTGMSESGDLVLSQVFHKCYLEVNEEGTEAAAASSASLASRSLGATVIFVADHPFLFFIRHNKTKSILFLGRFSSP